MDDSSIAGRTEKLRREIGFIQRDERLYRSLPRHSLAEREAHVRRELRLLQIREALRTLIERAKH
jgi:hypothetical protein